MTCARTCDSCGHWRPDFGRGHSNWQLGECRAKPPNRAAEMEYQTHRRCEWPITQATDWCGDWIFAPPTGATESPMTPAQRATSDEGTTETSASVAVGEQGA